LPAARKSLLLSFRNAYEALAVSAPTVVDAARGTLTRTVCDDRLERFASHVLRNAEISLTVRGREHLGARTYVVMSNHQSHYDVPVLYCVIGGNMRMVAKKELFALPVFGRAIRDAGMIEVDRQNRHRAIASLQTAKEQLAEGTHIWIAPEGTRSPQGDLLPFKKGGFVLAIDMEAPILPITIRGTRNVLASSALRSRRGEDVHVTIHPPVETRELLARTASQDRKAQRDALMEEVRRAIASAL
jgi:1-acyl-sn-glycerol-3-phosphate acyltransferase